MIGEERYRNGKYRITTRQTNCAEIYWMRHLGEVRLFLYMFVSLIDLISPTREYFFGCGVVISLERDEPTMDPCKSENWQMQEWTEYKFTGNTNKDITNIRKTVNDYIETIESTLEDIKNKQEQKQHAADCCNKQYARRLQVDP